MPVKTGTSIINISNAITIGYITFSNATDGDGVRLEIMKKEE